MGNDEIIQAGEHGADAGWPGYVSADSGNVGVGDHVTLAGHRFKFVGYSSDGKAILKNDREITVPLDYVPRDKGTPVQSVFEKLSDRKARRHSRGRGREGEYLE